MEFADDDADAGEIRYDHTNNYMGFHVNNNTERLRITSDGKVGIGTVNPLSPLSIFSDAADEELLHFDMGSPTARRGWKFKQGNTGTATELVLGR